MKKILSVIAVVLAFCLVFALVQQLLSPKYMTEFVEGSMLSQYYREAGGHDVIFIGDCEIYANISPMELWRNRGITAYLRGSSQQAVWQSYYLLEETLTYETPKAVVFNVGSMRLAAPESEAYNRMTIDKLRWSEQKVKMIEASMMEDEDFLSYVFPLLRYHSRFDELTQEDFTYLFQVKDTTWNGHLMNTAVKPAGRLPSKRPLGNYQFADVCYRYLDKITALCKEKGVELILMKAPCLYPYWYEEYDAQMVAYAQEHGLTYYNFTACMDEIGLDFQQDTYDGGLHLNLQGAKKLGAYLAEILATQHGIPDHRQDPDIREEYDEKLQRYDEAAKKG